MADEVDGGEPKLKPQSRLLEMLRELDEFDSDIPASEINDPISAVRRVEMLKFNLATIVGMLAIHKAVIALPVQTPESVEGLRSLTDAIEAALRAAVKASGLAALRRELADLIGETENAGS